MEQLIKGIVFIIEQTSFINYALQQNRIPIIQKISIQNDTQDDMNGVVLKIYSEPETTMPYEQHIDMIPAQSLLQLDKVHLSANASYLAGLTERINGHLRFDLYSSEKLIASETHEIISLAFDEWQGTFFFPELLASFITPNHPQIARIVSRASELLDKWTANPSLDAYQSKNPNRVLSQAAAVYGALQAENIVYSVPPASFEVIGQRIRLCDAVLQQKMGTCLDLTLLYAACLEAIGLHPLLILQKGHIFAGIWLDEFTFTEAVLDDWSLLTKKMADGINEIAVVECTTLVSGKNIGFDDAKLAAIRNLGNTDKFEYVIDVKRARLSGIRPLPLRIQSDRGWTIEKSERDENELTNAPSYMSDTVKVSEEAKPQQPDKLVLWERKLLDFGLRNNLINMRITQSVIPIITPSIHELEDALADGSEYGISSHPMEWDLKLKSENILEGLTDHGQYNELIKAEFKNKRLRSILSEGELNRAMTGLYRSAKVSLDENGANTLYLALGLLRWYETKNSQKPRYAPIILLPLEIIRKSANRGYVIRLRDEEAQMNITLLEMLKQDYGITISGLDPLPMDEHGIDMRCVFSILRKAIMDQPKWDVIESTLVGIFSFSQFVMWNDLRNRKDDLLRNKIVHSLINGTLSWEAQPMQVNNRVSQDGVLLPIAADASQLYAIKSAAEGTSFVLHGPPGTGKSQTITALIANALSQGKTVLFVAEKMAALSVVQKRLQKIGIGAFCLELHSNKSSKRDVLEQLRIVTEVTKLQPAEFFGQKADQIAHLIKELDSYTDALHKQHECGLTLFEAINRYEANRDASDAVKFPFSVMDNLDSVKLEKQMLLVDRLNVVGRTIGHPAGHPLRYINKSSYSQQIRSQLPDVLSSYKISLLALEKAAQNFSSSIGIKYPTPFKEWERMAAIAKELAIWLNLPLEWSGYEKLKYAMSAITDMCEHYIKSDTLRTRISSEWNEEFYSQDGEKLCAQWSEATTQWFLPKLIKTGKLVKQMAPFSKSDVKKQTLGESFVLLAEYQNEKDKADKLFSLYGSDLGQLFSGTQTDWNIVMTTVQMAVNSAENLEQLTGSDTFRLLYSPKREMISDVKNIVECFNLVLKNKKAIYDLLEASNLTDGNEDWLSEQLRMCEDITEHTSELKDWMIWMHTCSEAEECGLEPLIKAYSDGLEHEEVKRAYQKALYLTLINDMIEKDPVLNTFSGAVFNEKIAQFKQLDEQLIELSKTEIFCRLASKIPNLSIEASKSSEVGILQRAIRSGGRGISIRRLFEQLPNLLPRLCPCMLMSPISAAQYLDPKRTPFDIVVFDEASQMPTCKAVGALARGENAVVVGDPKQMPPTSFFMGNTMDEENLESEDLESILDDCLALNMPQTHLLWHYRSRHESLIAFSNNQFYENKLYTFPSVNDRKSKVSLVNVKGFFDRGKTRQNIAEAQSVVGELIRRCHDINCAGQSVGVVTFNISQQNLIDDLFTEACKNDPVLESWANEAEESLFIKNLENVQGDERDVILFSVGYGPDKEGNVYMNFGPLNRDGGWRRLNVAVSRARHEMMVFTTITPEQINLSRTSAAGVAALKAFLEYADGTALSENGQTQVNRRQSTVNVATSICSFLEGKGYTTKRDVGHSEYRIDIGIVDPVNPEKYMLGILLDGKVYYSSKSTRDREIAQINVLSGLGWKIHRVWMVDWWDNNKKELDNILKILDETKRENIRKDTGHITVEKEDNVQSITSGNIMGAYIESKNTTDNPTVIVYRATDLPFITVHPDDYILSTYTKQIKDAILKVIQQEAPICEGLLVRRVLQSFGISRTGSRIQLKNEELIRSMNLKTTTHGDQKVYWKDSQVPNAYTEYRVSGEDDRKRDAKDVPVQEAANAVCAVLELQIGLPREELVRETAKIMGYSRLGNIVITTMSDGIDYAIESGKIQSSTGDILSNRLSIELTQKS